MKKLKSEHGVICRLFQEPFGYFGWPSVAKTENGTLVAASSGLRALHVCPWGKTVLHKSTDNGKTWSDSIIINDSLIDDRDAGIISLGGEKLLVSWFSSDTRIYEPRKWNLELEPWQSEIPEMMYEKIDSWTDEAVYEVLGSWVKLSDDGEEWSDPIRVPVSAPHGPIMLAGGDLLYLGKSTPSAQKHHEGLGAGKIKCARSEDGGQIWETVGEVPIPKDTVGANFHEPHAVELPSGRLVGMIRYEHRDEYNAYENFSMFQTESNDGGKTWTEASFTGVYGSPPHLIRHSSGALACVYGYRRTPCGQRAMISYDEGKSWEHDFVIRDDGPDGDLGYPASVELDDSKILTVYYQKYAKNELCSLLYSIWELPERK